MKATLKYDNKIVHIQLNKSTITDDLYVIFTDEGTPQYKRLKLDIHPKTDVVLRSLELELPMNFAATDRVFCNGFQSWSESRLFGFDEKIDALRWFAKPLMGHYGDYHFDFLPTKKGVLHSWTYAYRVAKTDFFQERENAVPSKKITESAFSITENAVQQIDFVGSLDESTAFTCLFYDYDNQKIIIKKDLAGLQLSHSFPALDVLLMRGEDSAVFDQYFALQNLPKRTEPAETGWTSWYNYYNKISEKIIEDNLNAFAERDLPIDFFQIDDGWQTRIGDWYSIKSTFPNGMKSVADKIHAKGYKAGLWLAPFIVEPKSRLFEEKKHWILRGPNGKPLSVGYSPMWSGKFYALDFYNREVQDYVTGVFHTVLHTWGFDMVKLDFLYAVAVLPRPNKTRGQVMSDALEFLKRLVGDKTMLGCGVPLGSAFGKMAYCRIGADIHLSWEHQLLKFLKNRERVSTIVALRTTLGRWQLNGRAFHNDPDVFILRDKNHELTENQQDTILIINTLLGNLLFTSDFLGDYTEGTLQKFKSIFTFKNRHVSAVIDNGDDFYSITFTLANRSYIAYCNLAKQSKHIHNQVIKPFETRIWDSIKSEYILF